jgi:hypothetical protein
MVGSALRFGFVCVVAVRVRDDVGIVAVAGMGIALRVRCLLTPMSFAT